MEIITVTGSSGSGKTTFARMLRDILSQHGYKSMIIELDSYFHNFDHITAEERAIYDFDNVASVNSRELHAHIRDALEQKSMKFRKRYDFLNGRWSGEYEMIDKDHVDVLILEGLYFEIQHDIFPNLYSTNIPIDMACHLKTIRDVNERNIPLADIDYTVDKYLYQPLSGYIRWLYDEGVVLSSNRSDHEDSSEVIKIVENLKYSANNISFFNEMYKQFAIRLSDLCSGMSDRLVNDKGDRIVAEQFYDKMRKNYLTQYWKDYCILNDQGVFYDNNPYVFRKLQKR